MAQGCPQDTLPSYQIQEPLPIPVAFHVPSPMTYHIAPERILYQIPEHVIRPTPLSFVPGQIPVAFIQQAEPEPPKPPPRASGTSAVAIDNKIEQAMDLVKSHLMFAVREEVEVLKEKIAELMDRINQLELENTILKAHASQETLAQLSGNNPQQQGNKNQPTQPPSNGSVS